MLILNLLVATHVKQVRRGTTKGWQNCEMLQKHLILSSLVTGDTVMMYDRGILNRLRRSQAPMGRGSPQCQTHSRM